MPQDHIPRLPLIEPEWWDVLVVAMVIVEPVILVGKWGVFNIPRSSGAQQRMANLGPGSALSWTMPVTSVVR